LTRWDFLTKLPWAHNAQELYMEMKFEAGDVSLSVEYSGQTGDKYYTAEYEITASPGIEVTYPSKRMLRNLATRHLRSDGVLVLSQTNYCLRVAVPGQLSKQCRAAFFAAIAISTTFAGSPGKG
jgi:hypothetical protein